MSALLLYWHIAQLVVASDFNQRVVGSSPTMPVMTDTACYRGIKDTHFGKMSESGLWCDS